MPRKKKKRTHHKIADQAREPGSVRRRILKVTLLLASRNLWLDEIAGKIGVDARTIERIIADAKAVGWIVEKDASGKWTMFLPG